MIIPCKTVMTYVVLTVCFSIVLFGKQDPKARTLAFKVIGWILSYLLR
jgi:hypothetical protein